MAAVPAPAEARRHCRFGALAILLVLVSPLAVFAQATRPIPNVWVTDAQVRTVAEEGGIVYAGGDFSTVGPYTGGFANVDASTGVPDLSFPKVDGNVNALVSDNAGGWYVGGSFTRVGGVVRNNVAHVLADGRVSSWNPNVSGAVSAIACFGSSVYLGGTLTTVGGVARNRAAAVDAATGALLAWNPNVTGTGVYALAANSNNVFIGGYFANVGGWSRNGIARVDLTNGTLDSTWNPNPTGYTSVSTLRLSGTTLYVGGYFTVMGAARRNLAAVYAGTSDTGGATAWNPNPDGTVYEMALSGSLMYVGGFFNNIGSTLVARRGIAAVSTTTGATDPTFNPNPGTLGVYSVAVSGGLAYLGGSFTTVGGQTRRGVAVVDAVTGAVAPWNPGANASVNAVSPWGDSVALGGDFWSVGLLERGRLAAFDAATGAATAWNPGANTRLYALAASGGTIYAGGQFTTIGGQSRNYLAALDTAGNVTPWNPNPDLFVETIRAAGNTVVAGGDFTAIGTPRLSRGYIAALNATTGANLWAYGANSYVLDVSISGSSVYAGGRFTSPATRLAKFDLATGAADFSWNPAPSGTSDPAIGDVLATPSAVYVGGRFATIGGATRTGFAALDPGGTGAATAWDAKPAGGLQPESVGGPVVLDGTDAILAGDFFWLGGLSVAHRQWLGSVSIADATPTPWYVAPDSNIWEMVKADGRLFLGGQFGSIGGQPRKYLAAFCLEKTPTGLAVSGTGENLVILTWSGSAANYNVYRARVSGGPYELVGSTASPSFTDTSAEGGVLYYYVVKAAGSCESDPSNEVSATATGFCGLPPDFEGVAWATPSPTSCSLTIGWAPAVSPCGGGATYDVYRDTSLAFLPSGSNRIAAAIAGTSYRDNASLSAGTTYYYIVRATSTSTGEEDGNLIRRAATWASCTTWPAPVAFLGVTATSAQNRLEWKNPATGPYTTTRIRYNAVAGSSSCTFPTGPTNGTLLVEKADGGIGGRDSYTHGGLANDNTTYCYAAYVIGGTLWSAGRTAKGRPFDVPAAVKWAYTTGASATAPPGIGSSLFAVSNDSVLHGMARGDFGGTWPAAPWSPLSMDGPAQWRPTVIAGPPETVLVGSQDGYVYAVAGATGAELWRSAIRLGDMVQASPGAILAKFGGVYDYVLVGTRNSTSDNVFYALRKDTGTVAASFDNGGGASGIGIISGAATVDYATRRVIFASRARVGGSSDTLWCLAVADGSLTKVWSLPLGNIDGSPVVRDGVVYVGNNAGEVHAVAASDGTVLWNTPLATGDGPVKGFLYPDRSGNDLYFSTTNQVWRISDAGDSGTETWSQTLAAGVTPSIPLFVAGTNYLYVGGSDGQLWEIDLTQVPPAGMKAVPLGDGTGVVGAPTFDGAHRLVYVGTDAGLYYAVESPLP